MTTRSGFSILLATIGAVAGPRMVRADASHTDASTAEDIRLELTVGGESLAGRGVTSNSFHIDALAEKLFGDGDVRPLLAPGRDAGHRVNPRRDTACGR